MSHECIYYCHDGIHAIAALASQEITPQKIGREIAHLCHATFVTIKHVVEYDAEAWCARMTDGINVFTREQVPPNAMDEEDIPYLVFLRTKEQRCVPHGQNTGRHTQR